MPAKVLVKAALVGAWGIIPAKGDLRIRFLLGAIFLGMLNLVMIGVGSPEHSMFFVLIVLSTMGSAPQQSSRWHVDFLINFTLYV